MTALRPWRRRMSGFRPIMPELPGGQFSRLMPLALLLAVLAWVALPLFPQKAAFGIFGAAIGLYASFVLAGQPVRGALIKALGPLLFFMATLYLAVPKAPMTAETLVPLASQTFTFLLVFIAAHLFTHTDAEWVFRSVFLSGVTLFAVAAGLLVVYGSIRPQNFMVADVTGSFSNKLNALCLLLLPFAFLAMKVFRRQRLIWQGLVLLLIFNILMSESRAGLILIVAALGMTFNWYEPSLPRRLTVFGGAGVAGVAILILAPYLPGGEKITEPLDRLSHVSTFTDLAQMGRPSKASIRARNAPDIERALMYYEGITAIRENPITGIGYRGVKRRTEQFYGRGTISHNIIITGWAEFGLIGLISSLGLIGFSLYRCRRYARIARWLGHDQMDLFCRALFTSLAVGWVHAMARPQENNLIFMILVTIALSLPAHPAFRPVSARRPATAAAS